MINAIDMLFIIVITTKCFLNLLPSSHHLTCLYSLGYSSFSRPLHQKSPTCDGTHPPTSAPTTAIFLNPFFVRNVVLTALDMRFTRLSFSSTAPSDVSWMASFTSSTTSLTSPMISSTFLPATFPPQWGVFLWYIPL